MKQLHPLTELLINRIELNGLYHVLEKLIQALEHLNGDQILIRELKLLQFGTKKIVNNSTLWGIKK